MNDTPTVRLADRDWPVPVLAIKQNRIVVPAIMKLLPELGRIFATIAAVQAGGEAASMHLDISTEVYDLMVDAVYFALTRATPGLARNEFENMPISLFDLIEALQVVIQQSGAFKQAKAGEITPGEAQAAVSQTSTSSSPIIASAPESAGTIS